MSPAFRGLLLYSLGAIPACAVVFLLASGFFSRWDGHAVGVRPDASQGEAVVAQVLILDEDGSSHERAWPVELTRALQLPVNARGIPPARPPEDAPRTIKDMFSLTFSVQLSEGEVTIVPTTSPRSLAIAVLVFLVGLAGRNMWVSGSPLGVTSRSSSRVKSLPAAGQPAHRRRTGVSGTGPPPARKVRGRGRRR